MKRTFSDENTMLEKSVPDAAKPEAQNARAIVVLNRVKDKLTGMLRVF